MPVYLVRHGETRWNLERRLQGRLDSPLTLRGLEQIRGYGALLREVLPAQLAFELCTSPLPRARQTASMLAELLELPRERCSESELLAERYCGAWEGLTFEELVAQHGDAVRRQYREWDACIGGDGETLARVQERARAWLAAPRATSHVVVVSHGIFSRQLRGAYLGLDPADTMTLESHAQDRIYLLNDGVVTALSVGGA